MPEAVIVTDASVDLPGALCQDLGIEIAPLGFLLGREHRLSGQVSGPDFYAALEAGADATPTGVAADDFEAAFRRASARAKTIICLCQSFGSTFTRVSAEVAARRVARPGELSVEIVSPGRSSAAEAAICVAAARAAAAGLSAAAVLAAVESSSKAADTFVIPASLAQLERSGQLSLISAQSTAGSPADGVPVLRVRGRASLATVAGSLAEAESAVIDRIESIARDRPIITVATHAQNSGGAARLSAAAAQRLNVGESLITEIGPALGSLVGGGAHGLGFCVVQPAPGVAGSPG